MKVSFQGEPGAYSEQAVFNYYGEVETVPCESFDAMFDAVISGKSDFALAPIENSLAGSIHQNYDLLLQHDLHIVGECNIKKAISHPQALGQCAAYLRNLNIKPDAVYDTAGSVKLLKASGERTTAAIASRRAAELYEMQIIEEGIEDNAENYTRFLAVGREPVVPAALSELKGEGEAKTSIVFTLKNQPGALFKAMSVFALRDIDLTKIESRPLQGKPWEYLFYIDFIGSMQDDASKRALEHLGEYALTLRVLGSYPKFRR